jgi:Kef-type K+ transport system membrane component KefB
VVVFFGVALLFLRPLVSRALDLLEVVYGEKGVTLASFSFLLLLAFVAEIIGLDLIVGAFTAGLALSEAHERDEIDREFTSIINIFAGLFFVLIGVQINAADIFPLFKEDPSIFLFCGFLVLCAIAGKLLCGLAVSGTLRDKFAVGMGMVPRGEVGLILANFGLAEGILQKQYFSVLILVVIVTTFLGSSALRRILFTGK